MRKINTYSCENRRVNVTPEERVEIGKAVEREREDLAAEQARKARVASERIIARERLYCRRYGCDCMRLLRYEQERRRAFEDPTIYYRFVNQSYCNNFTGKSNINITELARKSLSTQELTGDILKKYSARA
jgi:hypothetical protein